MIWFEILLLCAGEVYLYANADIWKRKFHSKKHANDTFAEESKKYLFLWFLIPILWLLITKKNYTVKGLLTGYVAACILMCARRLHGMAKNMPGLIFFIQKAALMLLVYVLAVKNCMPAGFEEELNPDEAVLLFIGISVLLLFSESISRRSAHLLAKVNVCQRLPMAWLAVCVPILGFYLIEQPFNADLKKMEWQFVLQNLLWLFALFAVLYVLLPKKKTASGIFLTVCMAFGVGNYFITKFRGSPIMPNDLLAIGTALRVAGGYEFQITGQVMSGILCWYAAITFLCCLPPEHIDALTAESVRASANAGNPSAKASGTGVLIKNVWLIKAAAASLAVCICMQYLGKINTETTYELQADLWDVGSYYRTAGSAFGFAALHQNMKIQPPAGYISKQAEELLHTYQPKQEAVQDIEPSVIVIMDESFSDLKTLGDIDCSEDYLKHWYAVDDYVCRGKLYVSVYGGHTANSEFEFLTGNSMANCPAGVIPYQAYDLSNVGNMADILRHMGYETTAVHPEYKGNWNRTRTYANFGFHTFLGKDDFENPRYLRSHISDAAGFQKVADVLKKGSEKKQFIFHVTMQNHGGYDLQELSGIRAIKVKDAWAGYEDVQTYLTLIRESDTAIHQFMTYLRTIEKPIILCVFGDHLPRLNQAWVDEVIGKSEENLSVEETQKKYAVPYMIWTNYRTPFNHQQTDTSANYLGAMLLEQAGLKQTAYTNFLLQMQKEIPVYNAFGYQTKDGMWHSFEEDTQESTWIEQYQMLQYHALFDADHKMENYR